MTKASSRKLATGLHVLRPSGATRPRGRSALVVLRRKTGLTKGLAEKADTAILIRMERLGVRRAFPKKRLGVLMVSGPCLERLAKQSKCFRKVGWFAVPIVWVSRSSHPRAGWGHASNTTDVHGVMGHNATSSSLQCEYSIKKALSTSASGVLCQGALRANDKRQTS